MTWFTGIMVYLVVWWMVFFTVLPIGNRPAAEVVPGQAESAPARPRLWLKALATTAIAVLVWGAIYWVIKSGLISVRGG